jgi:hypothetical protein
MIWLELSPSVASRLNAYLCSETGADRSDHWEYYGARNSIRIIDNRTLVRAGFGFDSEYELNFRPRTVRERLGRWWRMFRGVEDARRVKKAYARLWSAQPVQSHATQAVYAEHYHRMLSKYPVSHYLEIGAGAGYLAARVYAASKAKITIVDLPEILPFSFLYLHHRFPDVDFALPGERSATFTFLTKGSSVESQSVDLAVNTVSFQEMTPEEISRYFHLLRRVLRRSGVFFTANREEKIMNGSRIRFRDYPWRDSDEILYDAPSEIHSLMQPQSPVRIRICKLAPA